MTVSDRASRGQYEDKSGPALVALLSKEEVEKPSGFVVAETRVVPDEQASITEALEEWSQLRESPQGQEPVAHLILTTGGTGFGPRDVTPEATARFIERRTPGLTSQMMARSLQITPHAMLSRAEACVSFFFFFSIISRQSSTHFSSSFFFSLLLFTEASLAKHW